MLISTAGESAMEELEDDVVVVVVVVVVEVVDVVEVLGVVVVVVLDVVVTLAALNSTVCTSGLYSVEAEFAVQSVSVYGPVGRSEGIVKIACPWELASVLF